MFLHVVQEEAKRALLFFLSILKQQLHPQVIIERDKVLRNLGIQTIPEREKWLSKVSYTDSAKPKQNAKRKTTCAASGHTTTVEVEISEEIAAVPLENGNCCDRSGEGRRDRQLVRRS